MNKELQRIAQIAFEEEQVIIKQLLEKSEVFQNNAENIFERAEDYVEHIRENQNSISIESFMQEYSLDSYEGVAIMCLAEALLRIPDGQSADELIRDKLEKGDWKSKLSDKNSFLINLIPAKIKFSTVKLMTSLY